MIEAFATRLLAWFARSGRHDLPWQHPRTAYRVWISEVMLQQTQVATVIPYFERFIARFPDLESLAVADLDDVLAHWAGLGYYSRARNMHRAATIVMQNYAGALPQDLDQLNALPGIGRSTAAAILAQAHGQRLAILDGNVKRVLSRHAAIEGEVSRTAVQKALWHEAEQRLPTGNWRNRMADYTQAIMDLGASVCTTRRPNCSACPVSADCAALLQGRVGTLPTKMSRAAVPEKSTQLVMLVDNQSRLLMQKRPLHGIWGGLWSLPELQTARAELETAVRHGASGPGQMACPVELVSHVSNTEINLDARPTMRHRFTHFLLNIQPWLVHCTASAAHVRDSDDYRWISREELASLGLPTPILKLVETHVWPL